MNRNPQKRKNIPDFRMWLKKYLKTHGQVDPIADLAADAQCDRCFPRTKEFQVVLDHMTIKHSACEKAVKALEKGFELFVQEYNLQ